MQDGSLVSLYHTVAFCCHQMLCSCSSPSTNTSRKPHHTHTRTRAHAEILRELTRGTDGAYSQPEEGNECDCRSVFLSFAIIPSHGRIIDGLDRGKGVMLWGRRELACNWLACLLNLSFSLPLALCLSLSFSQPLFSCGGHVCAG